MTAYTSYGFPILDTAESVDWLANHAGARRANEGPPNVDAVVYPIGAMVPVLRAVGIEGDRAALEMNVAMQAGLATPAEAALRRPSTDAARTLRNVLEESAKALERDRGYVTANIVADQESALLGAPTVFLQGAMTTLAKTAGVAADVAGAVLSPLLSWLWPLLLIIGTIVVVFLLLR